MVSLIKGQDIPEFPELELLSDTGNYDENDLVLACERGKTEAFAQFEAQFVKNGNDAYSNNNIPT